MELELTCYVCNISSRIVSGFSFFENRKEKMAAKLNSARETAAGFAKSQKYCLEQMKLAVNNLLLAC